MLSSTHGAVRLSGRAVYRSNPTHLFAPTGRAFHMSYRRNELKLPPTPGSGSSSRASSSSAGGPLSYTNIIIATAAIVIATPYALDLYGTLTGTTPTHPSSSSSSIPGKLEPYTHHPLPLSSSVYYPGPNTPSAHKLLQIALPTPTPASSLFTGDSDLKKRLRIRSVYIKEPSLVIERAYTPLYDTLPGSSSAALVGASKEEREVLDLLVKRYPDGELGKMLHRARPNPTVPQLEVRGPVDTWNFERDSASGNVSDQIVMVVGGTGVTPAYQLLTNLFGRPNSTLSKVGSSGGPRIDVLYGTPDVENALLLSELHALADANKGKVSVSLFAERLPNTSSMSPAETAALGQLTAKPSKGGSGGSWIPFFGKSSGVDAKLHLTSATSSADSVKIPVFESRITQHHLEKVIYTDERQGSAEGFKRTLVLVCGPDGMVEALAGPKSRDGKTQGQLSGILARIGLRQENVYKL